jgi:hypothetical protein
MDQRTTLFTANCARLDLLDVDVVVLAVSEDPEGSGRFLLFQRAKSFTEQDRALGMDTFAVTDPSGATAYRASPIA